MTVAVRSGVRLGVDVGTVRVGVAATDADAILAVPVCTLSRDVNGARDLHDIARLAGERAAIEIVIGHPRSLSGRHGGAAEAARDYARQLAHHVKVGVRLVDERLSTVQAETTLRDAGVPGRRQRRVVDQAAAVVILQAALDEERRTGSPPGELVT